METNVFGGIPEHRAVRLEPSVINEVHSIYSSIALNGKRGTWPEVEVLESVARALTKGGEARGIVLAGTDLSSFYAEQPPAYPFLDVARLHVDEIMRRVRAV
jgi:aspartate/glutamate racemase